MKPKVYSHCACQGVITNPRSLRIVVADVAANSPAHCGRCGVPLFMAKTATKRWCSLHWNMSKSYTMYSMPEFFQPTTRRHMISTSLQKWWHIVVLRYRRWWEAPQACRRVGCQCSIFSSNARVVVRLNHLLTPWWNFCNVFDLTWKD